MTRISDLTVRPAVLRFRVPVRYGADTLTSQEVGIVRLATDAGLVGLGEMAGPTLPPDLDATAGAVARQVLGMAPGEVSGPITRSLGGGLDTALLDLMGQLQGRSMTRLLGGDQPSVAVNGLLMLGGDAPDADARRAQAMVRAGFRTIKLKRSVGGPAVDTSLHAIRDALGPDIALRLDLNGDLSERDAVRWLATLSWLDLEYVEQPVAPALGPAAMARVRRAVPMPLAADESVTDADAVVALLDAGACDVLVVKPSRVGGPRAALAIARQAAAAGLGVTISTLYDSGIGVAAALHVAAAIADDRAHGLATGELLEADLASRAPQVIHGRMAVPEGLGLGVTLDARATADPRVVA
jgi:L-Ala-D/L-Glu epimerase